MRGARPLFLFAVGLLSCCHIHAQVNFYTVPGDLQLLPRDEDNFARFSITGNCHASDVVAMHMKVINAADKLPLDSVVAETGPDGGFTLPLKLKAQLIEYDLLLSMVMKDGSHLAVDTVRQLVAGDIFLVGGQSNAAAPVYDDVNSAGSLDSLYRHYCSRTIGQEYSTALKSRVTIRSDCRFVRPSCAVWGDMSYGFIGVWPLKLQHDLAVQTGIPSCFINSSQGATGIALHLPQQRHDELIAQLNGPDTAAGPRSLYERLYMKMYVNGLERHVRGIFWYQGESDGNLPIDESMLYERSFSTLYGAWKADYPSVQRIFLLQINTGCGGENLALIRQLQVNIADSHNDVTLMPTIGIAPEDRWADGCHLRPAGYLSIAEKLVAPVRKYIYHHAFDDREILPPRLMEAFYSAPGEICLRFDKDVHLQDSLLYSSPNEGVAYLRDYFYDNNGFSLRVKTMRCERDLVYLELPEIKKKIGTISYLPAIFTNIPSVYDGPWIVNERNRKLPALPFFKFPVSGGVLTHEAYVYPNPATGHFNINYLTGNKILSYTVYDPEGKIKMQAGDVFSESAHVDTGDLPSGIYYLEIRYPGGIHHKKLIVRRQD